MRNLVAVLVLACLVAASCGDTSDEKEQNAHSDTEDFNALPILQKSPSITFAGNTSRYATRTVLANANGDGYEYPVAVDGLYSYRALVGQAVVNVPMIAGLNVGTVNAIVSKDATYVKLPQSLSQLAGNKPWIKLSSVAEQHDVTELAQRVSLDPRQLLVLLYGVSDQGIKKVGTEMMRGESTTHYIVNIDPLAKSAAPADQTDLYNSAVRFLQGQVVQADVWLDNLGRIRGLLFDIDLSKTSSGTPALSGVLRINSEYYEFGTTVNANIPLEEEVSASLMVPINQRAHDYNEQSELLT